MVFRRNGALHWLRQPCVHWTCWGPKEGKTQSTGKACMSFVEGGILYKLLSTYIRIKTREKTFKPLKRKNGDNQAWPNPLELNCNQFETVLFRGENLLKLQPVTRLKIRSALNISILYLLLWPAPALGVPSMVWSLAGIPCNPVGRLLGVAAALPNSPGLHSPTSFFRLSVDLP